MTAMASDEKTSSELVVNFESRSRTRNLMGRAASARSPTRSRATWVTKALSGCPLTPRRWARLVQCSITNSTRRAA